MRGDQDASEQGGQAPEIGQLDAKRVAAKRAAMEHLSATPKSQQPSDCGVQEPYELPFPATYSNL